MLSQLRILRCDGYIPVNERDSYKIPGKYIAKVKEKWGIAECITEDIIRHINKDNFPEYLSEKLGSSIISKAGTFIHQLFWHPYVPQSDLITTAEWNKVKDKYNKGTEPRDNNLDILYKLTARHIVLIFNCFKELQLLRSSEQSAIIKLFLKEIIDKQGWVSSFEDKLEEEPINMLTLGVNKMAALDYKQKIFMMSRKAPNKSKDQYQSTFSS